MGLSPRSHLVHAPSSISKRASMQGHEHKVSFAPQPTAASPFGDADNLPPLPRKPAPQPSGQLSQQLSSKLGKGSKWNHNTSIAVR